jgi:hypothetical protein
MASRLNLWQQFSARTNEGQENDPPKAATPTTPGDPTPMPRIRTYQILTPPAPSDTVKGAKPPSRQSVPTTDKESKIVGKAAGVSLSDDPASWTRPTEGTEPLDHPIDPLEMDRRNGPRHYRRVAAHKTRRSALSIAVSEEEKALINNYAMELDRSLSEWARSVIFRAMGRKVPSRGRVARDVPK